MTLALIIGIPIFAIVAFLVYRRIKVSQQMRQLNIRRFERIQSIANKLHQGQVLTAEEVLPFALGIGTREATYAMLNESGKLELFPPELMTIEKSAEANLAAWLEFPTELDALPDEMQHLKRVTIPFDQENHVYYEVFQFRVNEPHWAAKDGWILGVVGPYFDDSKPYDHPASTFSRFTSSVGTISPDDEAKWVHQNISMRG